MNVQFQNQMQATSSLKKEIDDDDDVPDPAEDSEPEFDEKIVLKPIDGSKKDMKLSSNDTSKTGGSFEQINLIKTRPV